MKKRLKSHFISILRDSVHLVLKFASRKKHTSLPLIIAERVNSLILKAFKDLLKFYGRKKRTKCSISLDNINDANRLSKFTLLNV